MLPKTQAFVAFFFSIAVAQMFPPPPACTAMCCAEYLEKDSPALNALLGVGAVIPPGTIGSQCSIGNCTSADVGRQSGCCLYYAQVFALTAGCTASES